MVKINWSSPRKYLWLWAAIVFHFDKLFQRRDLKLWVFGALEGKKYDDNSKALFEYVNSQEDGISAVWITEDKATVEQLTNLGYRVCLSDSREGRRIQKEAGVAFYTHGLVDFGNVPRIGGAKIVSLWHGVGFKKIYNDKYEGWQLWAKRCLDKFFSWTYRDVTITTSTYVNSLFASTFGLGKDATVFMCGQPRNDVFKRPLNRRAILDPLNIDSKKAIILYMPTYRQASMGEMAVENIVNELYNNEQLDVALNNTNRVFVAKLHPLTALVKIQSRDNFVVLDYKSVCSVQDLLAVCDMLITDYSSCVVDYALLNRPIHFYLPDHEKFIVNSEPLYDSYYDIIKDNNSSTPSELSRWIMNPSVDSVSKINEMYEDASLRGDVYSENVYRAVLQLVKV